MITSTQCFEAHCDECGEGYGGVYGEEDQTVHYSDRAALQKSLARSEWSLTGERLLCPHCVRVAACALVGHHWEDWANDIAKIAQTHIDRIEAERDYMRLHSGNRSWLIHETIGALENRLDPAEFIRVHRSAIVRRERIARLSHDGQGNWAAELAGGHQLRIGHDRQRLFKALKVVRVEDDR